MAQQPFDSPPITPEPNKRPEMNQRIRQFAGLFRLLRLVIIPLAVLLFAGQRWEAFRTVIAFIITLSILVFVHEWGHYQFARWAGMRVKRFAIGFPPFIYTKRRNGIDYSIGALPIGGMVDIAGLGSEEEMVGSAKGTTSAHAAPDKHKPFGQRNFQDASLGWRFLTLFAGPLMNFVFALLVFFAVFYTYGRPEVQVLANKVSIGQPAAKAGLKAKDQIVSINGQRITDPDILLQSVRANGTQPLKVVLNRNGKTIETVLTPVIKTMDTEEGALPTPSIGIEFSYGKQTFRKLGFLETIQTGGEYTYKVASGIGRILKRAVTFRLTENDKANIGGPVKIAQVVGETARRSWVDLTVMAAALSVNLGLMNLLPIPALDGGRIMFIIYEAITRRPFDARKEGLVNAVGMAMVLTFMLFMTFRDVLPFSLQ